MYHKDYPATLIYYKVTNIFGDPSIMIPLKNVSIGNTKENIG